MAFTVEQMEIVAKALPDLQVFDLSEASPLIEEMASGYTTFGIPVMHRMPAQNCLFHVMGYQIVVQQGASNITTQLAQHLELAHIEGQADGEALTILSSSNPNIDPKIRAHAFDRVTREAGMRDNSKFYAQAKMGEVSKNIDMIVAQCCAKFVAFPISKVEPSPVPRQTRRRIARFAPNVRFSRVSLTGRSAYQDDPHSPGARRALHYCRGHWRRNDTSDAKQMIDGSWRIWIEGHWKGDPQHGIVLHEYTATIADVEARYPALFGIARKHREDRG